MPHLSIIPTPVGNLGDITLRAIEEFKSCNLIFAEDTRTSKKLLMHLEIDTKLIPFHAHNEHRTLENALDLIQKNEKCGLISDAGTPGISDPGFLLIRGCLDKNISVSCLPGATAFVPALVASGFPCDRFVFEGFLPHKKGRQTAWLNTAQEERTTVFYESPHRLRKFLEEAEQFCGQERKICVGREISKMYEEFVRGNISEVKNHFAVHEPRGEIVVVLSGKEKEEKVKKNKYKES